MARKFPRATTMAPRDSRGEPTGHYGAVHEGAHRGEHHRRARIEIEFDEQTVLGALFGQFDTNLVQIENRLGVYISARGNKALVEGPEDTVARARDGQQKTKNKKQKKTPLKRVSTIIIYTTPL